MNSALRITLDGEATLQGFTTALRKLEALLHALTADVTDLASLDWLITDLRADSAVISKSTRAEAGDAAEEVIDALVSTLRALRDGHSIPYSPRGVRRAHDLEEAITGRISALHLETEENVVILQRQGSPAAIAFLGAYGAVDGRIETLTSRRDLRFTLFDTFFDRGVACELTEDRRDLVRDAWGRRAIVEGWVVRHPYSGRPADAGARGAPPRSGAGRSTEVDRG